MKMLGHTAPLRGGRRAGGSGRWSDLVSAVGLGCTLGFVCALGLVSACQGSILATAGTGADALPRRDTRVTHAPCDLQGPTEKLLDANGDGRADVITVRPDGGRCVAYDLNLDGGVDSWVYEDAAGRMVRRELDFDRDGVPDEIDLYHRGNPTERALSTTVPGRLDTWHFYRSGKLVRTERDANGDGIIDQWWTYSKPECPVIQSDTNADGKPNPDSTIDLCKAGEAQPLRRSAGGHPEPRSFERPGVSPSEVPSSPEGGEANAVEADPGPGGAEPRQPSSGAGAAPASRDGADAPTKAGSSAGHANPPQSPPVSKQGKP